MDVLQTLPEYNYIDLTIEDLLEIYENDVRKIFKLYANMPIGAPIHKQIVHDKLFIIYLIAINNHPYNQKLREEFYSYLDNIGDEDLASMIFDMDAKPIIDYFVDGYLNDRISIDRMNNMEKYSQSSYAATGHILVNAYQEIHTELIKNALLEDEDVTDIILQLRSPDVKCMEEPIISNVFSRYATYKQLDKYSKESTSFLSTKIVAQMFYAILNDNDRFKYILNYYLSKGLSYTNIIELIINYGGKDFDLGKKREINNENV